MGEGRKNMVRKKQTEHQEKQVKDRTHLDFELECFVVSTPGRSSRSFISSYDFAFRHTSGRMHGLIHSLVGLLD